MNTLDSNTVTRLDGDRKSALYAMAKSFRRDVGDES